MKKFRYKFRPFILAVIISALVVAAAGIALNIWRIINIGAGDVYDYVSIVISLIVSAVGFSLFFAMLLSSSYTVTDEELILRWGLLKNKLPINNVSRVVLEQTKMQLVIYYNAEEYFVVNAKTVEYGELVEELRRRNGAIVYEITSIDEKTNEDKK